MRRRYKKRDYKWYYYYCMCWVIVCTQRAFANCVEISTTTCILYFSDFECRNCTNINCPYLCGNLILWNNHVYFNSSPDTDDFKDPHFMLVLPVVYEISQTADYSWCRLLPSNTYGTGYRIPQQDNAPWQQHATQITQRHIYLATTATSCCICRYYGELKFYNTSYGPLRAIRLPMQPSPS